MNPSPNVMAFMSRLLPPMTGGIALLIPGRDSRVALQNAKNNAAIIQLVAHVSKVLPPPGAQVALPELVEKCYALGSFEALWAVEGLGHYYADTFYERGEVPKGLLNGAQAAALPSKSLTMLHAGIGMAFAKRGLEPLKPGSPPAEIRKAVETFLSLCRDSSQEGYTGAAVESLGLASRFLHGARMVQAIDGHLQEIDPGLAGYLWHGAGRAVYFSPLNFLPGFFSPWRAVAMCRRESPHDLARRNMVAGFAWAIMLVNMRHPAIMETLLRWEGEEFSQEDAFSNGVMSSVIMRHDITPEDPTLAAFCQHEGTESADPKLPRLWNSQVKAPCERALQQFHKVLKEHKRVDEVFRYQDLPALVARLQETAGTKASAPSVK